MSPLQFTVRIRFDERCAGCKASARIALKEGGHFFPPVLAILKFESLMKDKGFREFLRDLYGTFHRIGYPENFFTLLQMVLNDDNRSLFLFKAGQGNGRAKITRRFFACLPSFDMMLRFPCFSHHILNRFASYFRECVRHEQNLGSRSFFKEGQ